MTHMTNLLRQLWSASAWRRLRRAAERLWLRCTPTPSKVWSNAPAVFGDTGATVLLLYVIFGAGWLSQRLIIDLFGVNFVLVPNAEWRWIERYWEYTTIESTRYSFTMFHSEIRLKFARVAVSQLHSDSRCGGSQLCVFHACSSKNQYLGCTRDTLPASSNREWLIFWSLQNPTVLA